MMPMAMALAAGLLLLMAEPGRACVRACACVQYWQRVGLAEAVALRATHRLPSAQALAF